MSKEEIDRILNSDFAEIDTTVSHKIIAIDKITGKLNDKTDFLAQFQLMLQNQLKNMKQKTQKEIGDNSLPRMIVEHRPEVRVESKFEKELEKQEENMNLKVQKLIEEEKIELNNNENNKLLYYKDSMQILLGYVCETKDIITQIKNWIKEQLYLQHKKYQSQFNHQFSRCIEKINKIHQQKINEMTEQINRLKEQICSLSTKKFHPLQQLTFQQNNFSCSSSKKKQFNITQKLRMTQLNNQQFNIEDQFQQRRQRDSFTYRIDSNRKSDWDTYRQPSSNHDYYLQSQSQSYRENANYRNNVQVICLPNIKPLTVGIPPVSNGFGILKTGSQLIYRGMWKNGKFEGKGELIWQSYLYNGDFINGCFSGYGRLQIGDSIYKGRFIDQKADGQGTLEQEDRRISGIWKENRLIRRD